MADDPVVGSAKVRLRPDTSGFSAEAKNSLLPTITKIGAAIAGAFVVKEGFDFIKSSANDAEAAQTATTKWSDAMQRSGLVSAGQAAGLKEQADALEKKTRFSHLDTLGTEAQLGLYKLTGTQLKELTPLVLDYAARTGQDGTSAAKKIGQALLGQGRALKQVGINFKDTKTLGGNFGEIMDGLRTKVGGFATKEGTTLAGKLAIMKNRFADVKEKVGAALLPILTKLAVYVSSTLIPAIVAIATWLGKHRDVAIALGVAIATGLLVAIVAMTAAWVADTVAMIAANAPIIAIVAAIALLVGGVVYAWTHFQAFRTVVTTVISAVRAIISGFVAYTMLLWHTFGSTILSYATQTWNNIKEYVKGALAMITGQIDFFKDLFTGKWSKLWGDVQQIIGGVWTVIKALVKEALDGIVNLLKLGWDAIGRGVKTGWSAALSFIEGLPGKIGGFFASLPGDMLQLGKTIIQKMIDGIKSMAGAVGSAVGSVISKIPGSGLIKGGLSAIGLARGGFVNFPTSGALTVLHGREVVLPLNDKQRALSLLAQSGLFGGAAGSSAPSSSSTTSSAGGGGVSVDIHDNTFGADPGEVGVEAARRLAWEMRKAG